MQRGAVYDATLYAGDPLTPGVGATRSAKRLSFEDAATLVRIPVLPIAYRDAEPLLEALTGPLAPPSWRGGLPLTYRIGPGPTTVRLKVKSDWALKEIHDVIAVMKGQEAPDEWVIRGNHHDAWVAGAWDPLSANVAMLAEAKAIGALVRAGYRPKRTLVYASWDGEEAGMLGSTEWVETHAAELKRKAVLYVNSDVNGRGLLGIGGSQALQRLVTEVANDVRDPEAGVSIGARKRARQRIDGLAKRPPGTPPPPAEGNIVLDALGSGSDFAAFVHYIGVASLNIGFGGESDIGGLYHTSYDTFSSYERFGDPGFKYGVTLAQTAGRLMLRTAFAERLPFSFTEFAEGVGNSLDEVKKLADTRRAQAVELGKVLEDRSYQIASDPADPVAPPVAEAAVPYFNFAPLENASARLKRSAAAFDKAAALKDLDDTRRRALNASLIDIESLLTDDRGLPNRPWFKNMFTAPGLYAGYSASTLPGLREAIEWHDFENADRYAAIIGARLDAYADRLDKAVAILTEK
jgi:N-acetylated-alpha-linked acidic dipeptidase